MLRMAMAGALMIDTTLVLTPALMLRLKDYTDV